MQQGDRSHNRTISGKTETFMEISRAFHATLRAEIVSTSRRWKKCLVLISSSLKVIRITLDTFSL